MTSSGKWIALLVLALLLPALSPCSRAADDATDRGTVKMQDSGGLTFRGDESRLGTYNSTVPANASQETTYTGYSKIWDSAAYWNRMIFFGGYDGGMHARYIGKGTKAWDYQAVTSGFNLDSTPFVYEKKLYFGTGKGDLVCLYAENGTLAWKLHYPGATTKITCSPVVVNGTVFFGLDTLKAKVYAVNITTRQEMWNFSVGNAIQGSPAYFDGKIYIGSLDGILYAVWAGNGTEAWRMKLAPAGFTLTDSAIYSTPAISSGVLYSGFGAYGAGGVAAVDARTGELIWRFGPDSPYNGSVYSSVAIHGSRLFFHRDLILGNNPGDYLYAINILNPKVQDKKMDTSELLWKFRTGENNGGSSPSVAGGKIVVGSDHNTAGGGKGGELYCVDEETGGLVWNTTSEDGFYASATIVEGNIVIGDLGGTLHVFTSGINPDMTLEVSTPITKLRSEQIITIDIRTTYKGNPVDGALIEMKATMGNLSQEIATTLSDGTQKVKYVAPLRMSNTTVRLSFTSSRLDFQSADRVITLEIGAQKNDTPPQGFYINWSHYTAYIAITGILAAFIAVFLVMAWRVKRRKK